MHNTDCHKLGDSSPYQKKANMLNSFLIQWAQSELDLTCKGQYLTGKMKVWQTCFLWKTEMLIHETNSHTLTSAPPPAPWLLWPSHPACFLIDILSDSSIELPCSQNPSPFPFLESIVVDTKLFSALFTGFITKEPVESHQTGADKQVTMEKTITEIEP